MSALLDVAPRTTHPERDTPEGRRRHREYNARWKARNPARHAAAIRAWAERNALARWCENQVRSAIRSGRLTPGPCAAVVAGSPCGEPKTHGHHETYDAERPLDVVWLCPAHHRQRHAELRAVAKLQDALAG